MDRLTTFLAWWGAVVSTAVVAWDVYKWRHTEHAKVEVQANGNLQQVGLQNPPKLISIRVTNNGDKPATVVLITFRYFKQRPQRWGKQEAASRGLFQPSNPTAPLPFKLEVGAEWSCIVNQTKEIEEMARDGYFYIEAENTATAGLKNPRTRLTLE